MTFVEYPRMDWDTSRRHHQQSGWETVVKVLLGIAITIVALPALALGILFIVCSSVGP